MSFVYLCTFCTFSEFSLKILTFVVTDSIFYIYMTYPDYRLIYNVSFLITWTSVYFKLINFTLSLFSLNFFFVFTFFFRVHLRLCWNSLFCIHMSSGTSSPFCLFCRLLYYRILKVLNYFWYSYVYVFPVTWGSYFLFLLFLLCCISWWI